MATYAHIENSTITGVYDLLPANWRNISNFYALKDSFDYMQELGWRTVIVDVNPEFNADFQKLSDPKYRIDNNEVVEYREVVNLPTLIATPVAVFTEEEQLAAKIERHNLIMSELRTKRNELLTSSDYTQLVDIITKNGATLTAMYVTYRQTLRDLPNLYENNLDFNNIEIATFPDIPVLPVVEGTPPVEETLPEE
jgi:hypothetical protein